MKLLATKHDGLWHIETTPGRRLFAAISDADLCEIVDLEIAQNSELRGVLMRLLDALENSSYTEGLPGGVWAARQRALGGCEDVGLKR